MKILKIVLISFFALIVLLLIAAVVIINTIDINKFKPQIIKQADVILARHVDFRNARLGIGLHGIGMQIDGLTISEDPAFGKGNFLEVKGISVGVDVLGYLLKRQISITGIIIDSPNVTIIRTKEGVINAQTITKSPETSQPSASVSVPAPVAVAIPALLISSLKGQNGTVKYIDHLITPAITLEVANVGFQINRLSLSDPFPFSCQATVLSNQQNIKVEGTCQIDMKNLSATITNLKAGSDLSRLVLAKIPQAIPMVPAQALPAELKGTVNVTVPELLANAAGLAGLNAGAVLVNGQAKFKEMAVPISAITAENTITEKDVVVKSFSCAIGQGGITGSGWLKNYLTGQDFNFGINAEKLSIADLVAPGLMPVKAEGMIAAKGQIKGHGFTPEALRTNLVGDAAVDIAGARLKGLNVLSIVLDKVSVIPGLGDSIKAGLPDTYKQKLEQKDTIVSDFKIPVTIVSGRVIIGDTAISSEGLFTFKAKGDAGFDGTYAFEGAFLVSQGLSKAIVGAAKPMQYLLNEDQMIYIPLKVSGTAGATMQFTVDTSYITKKLIENQARQQISKGLDKLFGGSDQAGQGDAQGQQPQQQNSDRASAEQAVNKLLKGIFK
jgi:hypothetical protein